MSEIVSSLHLKYPIAHTGKQKKYWVEIQLVDELGNPVSGIPYIAENDASKCNYVSTYNGSSDKNGIIHIEQLHWLDLTLSLDAQKLADEMENRILGVKRNPSHQPDSAKPFIYRNDNSKSDYKSEIQVKAEADGYSYQYVAIGELCYAAPEINGWDQEGLPEFHFPPQRSLKGYLVDKKDFNNRIVLEVCPFRAWILELHDTKDYSLANGLNLGIMADLAYSDEKKSKLIENFFTKQCLDLSTIPQFAEYPSFFHTLSVDVPFSERYIEPIYMNTRDAERPEGDTRLFYVECKSHLIVAWCGTDGLLNAVTDISFAPKKCPREIATEGNVHGGFFDAYNLGKQKFSAQFQTIKNSLDVAKGSKKLFICGHSLGGALGLVYAAEMKDSQPILHTYGMPRTFSMKAIQSLGDINHYRHVNDNDTIPQVPPDADLDNAFYETFGPLGERLGFNWAATTVLGLAGAIQQLGREMIGTQQVKDPYWHHGNIVIFFQAQQCVMKKSHQYQPWIGGGGRDNPAPGVVYSCEYASVKLYLVPSLSNESLTASGEHQTAFIKSIGQESLNKIFPRNTNPTLDGLLSNPWSHSMAHRYLPYIHNQVLELADPSRTMVRKVNREGFQQGIESAAKSGNCNQDELQRNRIFIELQNLLPSCLKLTSDELTVKNALTRYAGVTEEEVELSK